MAEIKTLMDVVTTREIKNYLDKSDLVNQKQPHTFAKFFPREDTTSLSVKWMREKIKIDRLLSPSKFDADIPLRSYEGISEQEVRMPFFREGRMFGEEDMERFQEVLEMNPNSTFVKEFIKKTFKSFAGLIAGSLDIPELMRAEILTTGGFTIKQAKEFGGNVTHKFNYDPNGSWASEHIIPLTTSTDYWSDETNSRPDKDIQHISDLFGAKGMRIKKMIVGNETFIHLRNNANIKSQVTSIYNPLGLVNKDTLMNLFSSLVGYAFEIEVDAEQYRGTDDISTYYYPQNTCATFIGEDVLGTTYFGRTPEEIAKSANPNIDALRLAQGMVISTKWKEMPIQKTMAVSMLTLPTFEKMDAVYTITWGAVHTYTVAYSLNGGTGTAPTAQTSDGVTGVTADAGTGITKGDLVFDKWNTKSDGTGTDVAGGATYTPTSNVVLYAQFKEATP